jgi:hypothetical protein
LSGWGGEKSNGTDHVCIGATGVNANDLGIGDWSGSDFDLLIFGEERMKKFRVVFALAFAIVGLALFVVGGSAEELRQATSTPTPTSTNTPTVTPVSTEFWQYNTPTLIPGSYDCPDGYPDGWGTVTPNSVWNLLCGQCIGGGDPYPTLTPAPTATGGPTPTAIPESVYYIDSEYYVYGCVYPEHARGEVDAYTMICSIENSGSVVNYYGWFEEVVEVGDTPSFRVFTDVDAPDPWFYLYAMGEGGSPQYELCGGANCMDNCNPPDGCTFSISPGTMIDGIRIYSSGTWHPGPKNLWVNAVYAYGVAGEEPTPTATPADSYCYQVDGSEESASFGWSGLTFGSESCLDIGPYEPLEIPHLAHICFIPFGMGSLDIFGVTVLLDVVLVVLAAILAIRWVT